MEIRKQATGSASTGCSESEEFGASAIETSGDEGAKSNDHSQLLKHNQSSTRPSRDQATNTLTGTLLLAWVERGMKLAYQTLALVCGKRRNGDIPKAPPAPNIETLHSSLPLHIQRRRILEKLGDDEVCRLVPWTAQLGPMPPRNPDLALVYAEAERLILEDHQVKP